MLRIRRIFDDVLPVNRETLEQVKEILRDRFSEVSEEEIEQLGEKLRNPFKQRFRPILFVAKTMRSRVKGFAMLLHEPEIGFCFLDWIATGSGRTGGGLGGALYDRVRREAVALGAGAVFRVSAGRCRGLPRRGPAQGKPGPPALLRALRCPTHCEHRL